MTLVTRLRLPNHALPGDIIVARLGHNTTMAFVRVISDAGVLAESEDAKTWLIPQDCVVRIVSPARRTRGMA